LRQGQQRSGPDADVANDDRTLLAYARAEVAHPEQASIVIYRVDCDPPA
jgi:hypothetical protein